jgi:hypothetical protein
MKVLYTDDVRDNQLVDSLFVVMSGVGMDHLPRES